MAASVAGATLAIGVQSSSSCSGYRHFGYIGWYLASGEVYGSDMADTACVINLTPSIVIPRVWDPPISFKWDFVDRLIVGYSIEA